ncbi:BACON domain-containing carbohydrate-binding protein [uncultured Alistipes sp.]|uniref:BACON domain-containing protein n=1 Tax=uncultured Alistipes sp. TaxID=538949 RepID=UPI002596CA52|nr:BACON domain-containing carbohydrate-binding protein [uncultured Alistipes sp.]
MKRIMNKWLWSLLCVTLLGAAACSDDDTEGDSGNPIPPALSTENLPDAGLKFLYSALTPHTFTMNVDAPWEITKTAGWFVVTPNKGEAGQNIQVTVTPALNQGEARDGEFTIRANSGNNLHPCLTEKSIPLSQDAYLAAGIVITGLDERLLAFEAEDTDPVVFTVEASYDWTLTVENETWLTVAPKSGKAGSAAQVTITPKANTTDERRESKITITAGDAEFGENTAEEIIELVQAPYMPKDTHAEGYVFFSDDFQWIPDNWVSPYTKYGWPSVSIDGTNGNEFALSTDGMKEAVAAKGYTYTPSVYARYEGHVKLGKTANMGAITIPALTGIDAGKAATLLVQFDAAAYSSAGGTVDNGDDHMDVTIEGPGTIGDLVETSALVEVKNVWEWTRYSLIVYGATNETRITFGSEREVKCRLYLDNITVTRAKDENPEAPAPEALVTPLDKEIVNTSDPGLFDANNMVVAEGGTLTCSVRVNKAWTAETDCDWLTITTVRCGDADPSTVTGANNGASLSNGVATVKATGLPYVTTKVEVGRNSGGENRTGHIIIKSEGAEIEKVAVTQAAEGTSVTGIVITGLTENQIPEFAADATAETTFTVRADTDWTIEVPAAETWYSVTPLSGAANTDVTVTVTPTPNTGGARDGSFTIQSGTNTETILLSQAPSASALHFEWSFPATAEENNMVSRTERWYKSDDGKARIDAVRAVDNPSNPDMSYSLGYDNEIGRILMYGFALDDYWLFTLPVKNFKANTTLNLRALISSSASGPKFYILEYSADGQASWTSVNTTSIEDKSAKDTALRTIVYTHMMPDTPANGDVIVDDDITIPTAVADGNIYLRLRVCDAMAGNKAKNIVPANGGTTRMKTKEGICDAISVTEVQR